MTNDMELHVGDARELAREAWRHAPAGPLGDIMRQSMRAMAHDDPQTHAALADEGAAFSGVLDLHLNDAHTPEHTVAVDTLTAFLRGLMDAVKETSKATLRKKRYSNRLLVTGFALGSVRVTLVTPPVRTREDMAPLSSLAEDVDAGSLAKVAAMLAGDDDSAIDAFAAQLPVRARAGLRRASSQIIANDWEFTGTFQRPGSAREPVHFTAASARRLADALGSAYRETHPLRVSGRIDGSRRSLLVMYFEPDSGRPFAAAVPNAELYERVVELDAPEGKVLAHFSVDEVIAAGSDSVVRRAYTLERIDPLELEEQGMLDA
ncbi:hypothetical protein [Demequina silvatica]|uniref:hypothetical protein n=1 Tax=Demequina silvatica TaxID=1638988 RepID=UPI0007835A50|nr:hypothetical protein [Demequina silvatica]